MNLSFITVIGWYIYPNYICKHHWDRRTIAPRRCHRRLAPMMGEFWNPSPPSRLLCEKYIGLKKDSYKHYTILRTRVYKWRSSIKNFLKSLNRQTIHSFKSRVNRVDTNPIYEQIHMPRNRPHGCNGGRCNYIMMSINWHICFVTGMMMTFLTDHLGARRRFTRMTCSWRLQKCISKSLLINHFALAVEQQSSFNY